MPAVISTNVNLANNIGLSPQGIKPYVNFGSSIANAGSVVYPSVVSPHANIGSPSVSAGSGTILQPASGHCLFGAYPGSSSDTTLAGYEGSTLANRQLDTFYRYYSIRDSGTIPTANDSSLASAGRTLAICLTPSWAVPPAANSVLYTDITAGTWDTQINALGTRIAAMPGPVFMMYQAEMDLAARSGYGTAAQFIASHQHVTNLLRAQAPGMVAMAVVFCHTSASAPYYPGDAYVDWFGYDPYDTGVPPTTPSAIYSVYTSYVNGDHYAVAGGSGSGGAHGKPIIIAETGVVQGTIHGTQDTDDAAWLNAVPAALSGWTSTWGSQIQCWQYFNSSGGAGQTAIIVSSYSAAAMANIGTNSFFN
jgi:hypothetical protein